MVISLNGQLSERKYFGYQGILVETTVDPSMAFKTFSGVAYFLRIGTQHAPGTTYPYMELLSSTLGDSIPCFIYNGYSNNCLAGADLSPLIYLYYLNQSDTTSTLEILDEHSSNVLKKISRISFFPSSLSKQGPVLVAAEIKDNEILLKGIRDSTLFRTTTLNGSA